MSIVARSLRKISCICAPHLHPAAGVLRRLRRHSITILMYHGITDEQTAVRDWCQVPVDHFRLQMEFLSQEYRVLPLAEVIHRLQKGLPVPGHTACLTFDDGFRSVYAGAWPVLSKYQLPSTVFVVTSLLDSGLPPWPGRILYALSTTRLSSVRFDDAEWKLDKGREGALLYSRLVNRIKALPLPERERKVEEFVTAVSNGSPIDFLKSPRATMTWSEVHELAKTGLVDIESHTHTHASLSNCSSDEQFGELKHSQEILHDHLRVNDLFCYPFGDYTSDTVRISAEVGYRCGLSTVSGLNPRRPDLYSLRRIGVGPEMTGKAFEMAMLGFGQ